MIFDLIQIRRGYITYILIIQNSYLEGSCVVVKDLLNKKKKKKKLKHVDSLHSTDVENSLYNGHVQNITIVGHYQIYVHELVISLSRKQYAFPRMGLIQYGFKAIHHSLKIKDQYCTGQ